MKKISNKMVLILLLIILLINISTVKAEIVVTYSSDGDSIPFSLPACIESMENCGYFSQDFDVRVTMVDQNNRIIEGTKTVGFQILPTSSDDTYEHRRTDSPRGGKSYSSSAVLDPAWSQDKVFVGSSVAKKWNGVVEDYTDETEVYAIKMSDYYGPNDWSNYEKNRQIFFEDATNVIDRNGEINVNGKQISFISFFLKKCGYTDSWNGLSDEKTIKKLINFIKEGNEIKLLVEPVYEVNVEYAGVEHTFLGTAKQLATMLYNSNDEYYKWFWPAIAKKNMYNLYNNMIDRYDTTIEAEIVRRLDDFDLIGKHREQTKINEMWSYYYSKGCAENPGKRECSEAKKQIDSVQSWNEFIERNELYTNQANEIFEDISRPRGNPDGSISAMGISVINLTGSLGEIKSYYNNNCNYTITTCNDNKFEFSARLSLGSNSDGDLFDCIYPSDTSKISTGELKNISSYNEENDLWCYDDINYNFFNVGHMNGGKYKSNQLVTIPTGSLKVDRTCYSKRNLASSPASSLNSIFEVNNNMYQKNFTLTLNGKKYTYKRDDKYTINSFESNESISKQEEEYYTYKTQLEYTYSISEGYNVNPNSNSGLNIGIKDYNLTNGLWNTKSINYETAYKGNAIVLKTTEFGIFKNALSTDADYIKTQLTKAFGLSNKLYDEITDSSADTEYEGSILVKKYAKTIEYDDESTNWKNNYTVTEKIGGQCTFETEVGGTAESSTPAQFRVISLSNPFPARDGSSRMPGSNWLTDTGNNVYDYIQNNRGVTTEEVYKQEPIYKITLDSQSMVKIREYNKTHTYSNPNITCEKGTGRMCISSFIRNNRYLNDLEGTCSDISTKEITTYNNEIKSYRSSGCTSNSCQDKTKRLDTNKDGKVNELDFINAEFYSCANKTAKSGG